MTIIKNIDGVSYTFEDCLITKIENPSRSIVLPESINGHQIVGVMGYVLNGDKKVKSITIPKSYSVLYPCCFINTVGLKEVIFEKGSTLHSIPPRAFCDCVNLEKIILPDNLEAINSFAFAGCKSLKDFSCPKTLQKIQLGAFKSSGVECININKNLKIFPTSAIINTPCSKIVVNPDNKNFYSKDGVLFSNTKKLLLYPPGKTNAKYVIPNDTEKIATLSISDNEFLKEIVIPPSVKFIEYKSFYFVKNLNLIIIKSENTLLKQGAFSEVPVNAVIRCPKNYNCMNELNARNLKVAITDKLTTFMDNLSSNEVKELTSDETDINNLF